MLRICQSDPTHSFLSKDHFVSGYFIYCMSDDAGLLKIGFVGRI